LLAMKMRRDDTSSAHEINPETNPIKKRRRTVVNGLSASACVSYAQARFRNRT
jgi:hypothetical protein